MTKIGITNIEVIHSLGQDGQAFWSALLQPPINPNYLIDELKDLHLLAADRVRRMDAVSQLLAVCTKKIINQLKEGAVQPAESMGMCTSSNFSTFNTTISFMSRVYQAGPARANPMEFPNASFNACSGYACMEAGLKGYNNTVGGFGALGEAYDAILLKRAQAMVAAGVERVGAIQKEMYNQYQPDVPPLSEGSAALLLNASSGQQPLAWYGGYESGFDCTPIDQLADAGHNSASLLNRLLRKQQLHAQDIDGLVLSTGILPGNHARIMEPLQQLFSEQLQRVPIFHLETHCGYVGGTAEVLAASIAVQMLHKQTWVGQQSSAGSFHGRRLLVIITDQFGCNHVHLIEKA